MLMPAVRRQELGSGHATHPGAALVVPVGCPACGGSSLLTLASALGFGAGGPQGRWPRRAISPSAFF